MRQKHDNDFNQGVIEEFRANGGQLGGDLAGATVILVHHIGARTGAVRVVPLIGIPQDGGRVVVTASNGGSPTHPSWVHNLRAHPMVTVELGRQTLTMQAEEWGPAARVDLWPTLLEGSPALRDFDARTAREIPVFVLTPV
ncbi:nitroreductase/quinone reductase family protein [Aeromicrobium sp.]|uniref:nitroreductase/quinone reductase family protein n=1 Tax=Aeromicrobium sp. TaxID=1871063 RepID=UPI002FCB7E94